MGQGFGDMSEGVRGEGASQMVVSDFSDMFTFRTLEDGTHVVLHFSSIAFKCSIATILH